MDAADVGGKLEEFVLRLLLILLRRWRNYKIIRSQCWWKKLCWMNGITAAVGEKSEEGVLRLLPLILLRRVGI